MPAWIQRIATAVPDFSFSQEEAGAKMQEWARSDRERDMAWRIGDRGFDICLSSYIPKILGANLLEFVEPSLADAGVPLGEPDRFAVHPGGKSILDQVQRSLGLRPDQVHASREVLRKYGNMSSPSILFVLEEILRQPSFPREEQVCALAFGPGLTVEMALLSALPDHAGGTADRLPASAAVGS